MRVLFAGTPKAALPTLEALMTSEHDVVGVLTRADARQGRGRTLHPSPVAAVARDAGLDVRTPATLKGEQADDVRDWVRDLRVDVAVVVAYGRLVPADLLDAPEHGWLNLHFSLLPAWRGAAPVQRAVIAGEEVTGACVFRLEEGLDTGPVYGRVTRPSVVGTPAGIFWSGWHGQVRPWSLTCCALSRTGAFARSRRMTSWPRWPPCSPPPTARSAGAIRL